MSESFKPFPDYLVISMQSLIEKFKIFFYHFIVYANGNRHGVFLETDSGNFRLVSSSSFLLQEEEKTAFPLDTNSSVINIEATLKNYPFT